MRELTLVEFNELTQNESEFLLFCCGTDCTKCRMQEPELERVEWEMIIPLYKINAQEEPRAADRFDITVLPTIIKMKWSEEFGRLEWDVLPWDSILAFFNIKENVEIQNPSK